jgi:membrane protein DedA with SNARE-associated domain
MVGAAASYYLGIFGGRPLAEKYGKYLLISHHDLDRGEKWFGRFGEITVFIGQMLPLVRNFISITAGINEQKPAKFFIFTFVGAFIWSYTLAFFGFKLGENWEHLKVYFQRFDIVIVVLIILGLGFWIYRHLHRPRS